MSVSNAEAAPPTWPGINSSTLGSHSKIAVVDQESLPESWNFALQLTNRLSRSGLLIVDKVGFVHYINDQARIILDNSDMFDVRQGRLVVRRSESQRAFKSMLDRGLTMASADTVHCEAIGIPEHSGAARYAVSIIDIYLRNGHPNILLSISDFATSSGPGRSAFVAVLGLSVREAELADLFSRGLTLQEIATAMGITFNTARVHLQNIYCKTHCSGQIALSRLLCRVSTMPFPAVIEGIASTLPVIVSPKRSSPGRAVGQQCRTAPTRPQTTFAKA